MLAFSVTNPPCPSTSTSLGPTIIIFVRPALFVSAIVEDILSPETAARLREYILKANHEIENTYVHEQENRYRIM